MSILILTTIFPIKHHWKEELKTNLKQNTIKSNDATILILGNNIQSNAIQIDLAETQQKTKRHYWEETLFEQTVTNQILSQKTELNKCHWQEDKMKEKT